MGKWHLDPLKILLMAMIFYLPNQAQFGFEFTIRGLNTINILFILIFFVMRGRVRPTLEPTPMKGAFVFFCLVLVWAFLIGFVRDGSQWVEDLTILKNSIFYMLLYFLFFHAVDDRRTILVLVLTIAFVLFTSVVLGFRQALDYGIGSYNETRRVAAPFGWGVFNANRSAIYFCIFLPLLLSMGLFYKSRPWLRLAAFAIFFLGVFVVFHTYSRQAYFILAVIVLLMTLRKNLLVTALVCLALWNYDVWVPETVIQRIEMTSAVEETPSTATAPGEEPKFDESTASRFIFWEAAWEMIQEYPLGIGLDHFKREIGAYVPSQFAGKDAHNFYILFTTEAGLVAPIAILAMFGGMYALGRRVVALGDDEEARMLGAGYLTGVVALMLGNIYGSRFLDGDVMGNFWILSGLLAKYVILRREESEALRRAESAGQREYTQVGNSTR